MTYQYIFSIGQETEKELKEDIQRLEEFLEKNKFLKFKNTTLQGKIESKPIKLTSGFINGNKSAVYITEEGYSSQFASYEHRRVCIVQTSDKKLWDKICNATKTTLKDERSQKYFLKKTSHFYDKN